jgi:hypothetical protein
VQGQHGSPELHPAVQDEHDPVAFFHAPRFQRVGKAAGLLLEISEGILPAFSVRTEVNHGQPARVLGQFVQHVERKVEVLGNLEFIVGGKVLVGREFLFFHHSRLRDSERVVRGSFSNGSCRLERADRERRPAL